MAAVAAAQPQKAAVQDAALEKGVELVFDELRQAGAGLGLSCCAHVTTIAATKLLMLTMTRKS